MDTVEGLQVNGPEQGRRLIRRRWWIAAVAAVVTILLLVVGLASIVPFSSETARDKLVAFLSRRLESEVQLDSLRVQVLPKLRVEGRGLTIRHMGRRDVPPLISIKRFSAEASVSTLYRRHISTVAVDGLDIQIPPDHNRTKTAKDQTPDQRVDAEVSDRTQSADIA